MYHFYTLPEMPLASIEHKRLRYSTGETLGPANFHAHACESRRSNGIFTSPWKCWSGIVHQLIPDSVPRPVCLQPIIRWMCIGVSDGIRPNGFRVGMPELQRGILYCEPVNLVIVDRSRQREWPIQ
jgi:hypothetical protein